MVNRLAAEAVCVGWMAMAAWDRLPVIALRANAAVLDSQLHQGSPQGRVLHGAITHPSGSLLLDAVPFCSLARGVIPEEKGKSLAMPYDVGSVLRVISKQEHRKHVWAEEAFYWPAGANPNTRLARTNPPRVCDSDLAVYPRQTSGQHTAGSIAHF